MKHNWTYKKLGEMVNIRTGKLDANAANEGGKYPFFTCSREPLRIDTYSYDCECVLVAGNGELNVKYYNGKFDAYQRTYIIEKKPEVDYISTYYIYLFFQKYIDVLRKGSIGGIIKYIKLGDLTNAIIPIPSLDEQQAIVRELDGINHLIDLQEEQLREYDRLAQSLFYTTFGDPATNPKRWDRVRLDSICENRDSKRKPVTASERIPGDIPYYGASGIVDYVRDYIFDGNYLLVSEDGANLLARVTPIAFSISGKTWVNNHAHILEFDEPSTQLYVQTHLNFIDLSGLITGAVQPKLNQAMLNSYMIPLPPLALQQSFAAQIEAIEQQKALIRRSLDETRTLLAARMQYYFE